MTEYFKKGKDGVYNAASEQERIVMGALLDVVNSQCRGMTVDQVANCFLSIVRATCIHVGLPEHRFRRLLQQAVDDNPDAWQRIQALTDIEGHA